MTADWQAVDRISAALAPSPYAGIGETIVRAIISYAGKATALRRAGQTATAYPFTECLRATIAAPGRLPLETRLFALIDVPDYRILPQLWPEVRDVWVAVGTQPEFLFKALIASAWLVRWRLLPSLNPFIRLILIAMSAMRWGERRSGMFVQVEGRDGQGPRISARLAPSGRGRPRPYDPSHGCGRADRTLCKGASFRKRAPAPLSTTLA